MERLNSDKLHSISSALDFFGDNVQQNNVTATPDNPMETINSKNKEKKSLKRKRDKGEDVEEALPAKKSSSTKSICLTACGNITGLLYQVMPQKIANQMSVILMMRRKRRLLCYQATPLWILAVVSNSRQGEKS